MNEVLQACLQRITALENEVAALKRNGPIRTCVIDWLDTNVRATVTWRTLINTAHLDIECLDAERDMCNCAASWIANAIGETQQIRSFRTLPKCVFAYDHEGWVQFDHKMNEWLFDRVARRFLEVFQAWSQKNESLIQSDKHNAIYFQRLQKITQNSSDRAAGAEQLATALYKRISCNNPPGVTFFKS